MKTNVIVLDGQIKFLREQASRLRDMTARPGNGWAEQNATKMDRIVDVLLEVRRDLQMTTLSGKPLEERPDREVLIAVPELQNKKALVCYFATDKERDEFAAAFLELMPTARCERLP